MIAFLSLWLNMVYKSSVVSLVSYVFDRILKYVTEYLVVIDVVLGSDDSSSDDSSRVHPRFRRSKKGPSIAEGPEAISSKLRPPCKS